MSTNQVQLGRTLTFSPVPTGGLSSGDPILIGAAFGICQTDAPEGGEVEADVEGVFSLAKTAGQAVPMGQKLYFVTGTGLVGTTGSGNTPVGFAARAAAAGDATVDVRLVPMA